MTEKVIKYTKSLSPLTLKNIDAKIVLDENNIYLSKKDENGQEYKTLIERDPDLYFLLSKPTGEFIADTQSIHAYVSSRCNLNCKVCYEESGIVKEASLEEITALLDKYRGCRVVMMGREPTCREDIFSLIQMAEKRTCLVTNGIKLENPEYVKKLKMHGLKRIFFSFNGLTDEIYQKMNGENLLEKKLKALENIECEKIDTVLSATVARDINENQILPLAKYCFDRRSFIFELRIRTLAPIGKHLESEQICMSELIGLIADSLSVNKTDIIREFCFIQSFIENFSWLLPKGLIDKYRPKLCSFILYIKKERGNTYSSPGSRIDLNKINKSMFKSLYFLYYLIKAYGPLLLLETALNVLKLPRFVSQKKLLNITLKCWPNLYNVDLTEMNKCTTMYYRNGEMEKYCLSNIKNSEKKAHLQ
jgi:uncharacterized Fe-S cluster-containing radical SAM superfamily protein